MGRLVESGASWWAVVPVALASLLTGCGDEHLIQWQEQVIDAEGARTVGVSCGTLGEGDRVGSGGGAAPGAAGEAASRPGYQLQWDGLADGVRLSVSDVYGVLVEEREFDEAFLESGEREEITPALPGGGFRLVVWGGNRCDPIDASDFE